MKAIFLFAILFSALAVNMANELNELERKIYAECKVQEGASDDDIKKILNRDVPLPTNRNARCAIACAHEKIGVLKNDQFDMDVLSAIMVKKFSGDQKLAHDAIEVIRGCLQPIESDRCDKITQILECSYAKWYTSEEHKQKDRL